MDDRSCAARRLSPTLTPPGVSPRGSYRRVPDPHEGRRKHHGTPIYIRPLYIVYDANFPAPRPTKKGGDDQARGIKTDEDIVGPPYISDLSILHMTPASWK